MPSIRAEGDKALLEKLEIRVENGVLQIGYKKGNWSFGWRKDHGPVTVHVSAPSLTGAEVAGSGDMKIDKVDGGDFAGEILSDHGASTRSLYAQRLEFATKAAAEATK